MSESEDLSEKDLENMELIEELGEFTGKVLANNLRLDRETRKFKYVLTQKELVVRTVEGFSRIYEEDNKKLREELLALDLENADLKAEIEKLTKGKK